MKIKVKAQVKELSMTRHPVKTGKNKQKPKYEFSYEVVLNFLETKKTCNIQFIEALDLTDVNASGQKLFASLKNKHSVYEKQFDFLSQHSKEAFLVTLELPSNGQSAGESQDADESRDTNSNQKNALTIVGLELIYG